MTRCNRLQLKSCIYAYLCSIHNGTDGESLDVNKTEVFFWVRIDNSDDRLDSIWRESSSARKSSFFLSEIDLIGLVTTRRMLIFVQGQLMLASAIGRCNQRLALPIGTFWDRTRPIFSAVALEGALNFSLLGCCKPIVYRNQAQSLRKANRLQIGPLLAKRHLKWLKWHKKKPGSAHRPPTTQESSILPYNEMMVNTRPREPWPVPWWHELGGASHS